MLKLTLEAIELVDAIARYGSFAGASERLHKVPSTISYAVGKLEEQLGLALFTRNGPRVALTPAGHELLKEGRWLLAAARQLESRLRQIATGFESELRLVHDSLIPTSAFNDDIAAFEGLNCGTRLRIGKDGRPVPGSGSIAVRCDGPMTTTIEHNPLEPEYFRDTDWSWSFEGVGGRAVMAGSGAKVMRPVARRELRLYVREGYLDP